MDQAKRPLGADSAVEQSDIDGREARQPGRRQRRTARRLTARYLENAALYYLQRFATSSANLRRVLMRRVDRSARAHGTDPAEGAALVEALIARFRRAGLLDDASYAAGKAQSLLRRGGSMRAVRRQLAAKGVEREEIDAALDRLATEGHDDVTAAIALVRRRRLGPLRAASDRAAYRERDLATLGRAGFAYDTARQVLACADEGELDALERRDEDP